MSSTNSKIRPSKTVPPKKHFKTIYPDFKSRFLKSLRFRQFSQWIRLHLLACDLRDEKVRKEKGEKVRRGWCER
jgi:hypothetical protein